MQLFGDTAIQHLSSLALRCLVKNAGTQVCPHLSSVLERKLPVIVFNLDEPGVRAWISRSGTARIVLTGRCAATAVAAGLVAQLAVGIRLVDLIVEDMVTGKEGLLSSGVGYTLQILAQKGSNPTVISLLLSLESVFATISGAAILGDRLSGREYFGCALMLAAVVLAQLPDRKKA